MTRVNERQRWYPWELVEIFTCLNDNFDLWYENPREACIKAIQVTGTSRNIGSVHAKVSKMTRAMSNYIRTDEKTSEEVIWKNKDIYDIVKRICKKSEKKKKEENRKRKRNEDEEEEQEFERKRKTDGYFETDVIADNDDVKVIEIIDDQETDETPSQMNVDPQIPFSIEAINELYKRKMQEAEQDYEQIQNLTGQIFQLESDLKKKIEERNIKVEKLKDFRFLPMT